ncbi:MAG: hypothetical protein NTZ05_04435 [Chloroflexi bacterium]|nr:hypothetical protein [Chloroflexota bacterium]
MQEALYENISPPRRRRSHLRAAQALEALAGERREPHVEELARHYSRAGRAEQAAGYAFQAGQKAERLFSWQQAVSFYEQARVLWDEVGGHSVECAAVLEHLMNASYFAYANVGRTEAYARQAIDLYEQLGDRANVGRLYLMLGRDYMAGNQQMQMDQRKAQEYLYLARNLLADQQDSPDLLLIDQQLLTNYESLLQLEKAIALGRGHWERGERNNDPGLMAQMGAQYGYSLVLQGKIAEGFSILERGWELAQQRGLADRQDFYCVQAGTIAGLFNDPAAMARWVGRTSGVSSRYTEVLAPVHGLTRFALTGELLEGKRVIEYHQGRATAAGQPNFLYSPPGVGCILHRLGAWEEAAPILEEGLAWANASGFHTVTNVTRFRLAEALADRGDPAGATRHLLDMLAVAQEAGALTYEANAYPRLAVAAVQLGDLEAAERYLNHARAIMANGEE